MEGQSDKAVWVFIGPKIFVASPWRRAVRSGEECPRSGVETFAPTYPKVGKGLRSGEGFSATAYQEGMQQNCMLLRSGVEFYAAAYQNV